jgi:hypothetical protein
MLASGYIDVLGPEESFTFVPNVACEMHEVDL